MKYVMLGSTEVLVLDKEDCKKIRLVLEKDFINQNESPGKEAYPILKQIMEFGGE